MRMAIKCTKDDLSKSIDTSEGHIGASSGHSPRKRLLVKNLHRPNTHRHNFAKATNAQYHILKSRIRKSHNHRNNNRRDV